MVSEYEDCRRRFTDLAKRRTYHETGINWGAGGDWSARRSLGDQECSPFWNTLKGRGLPLFDPQLSDLTPLVQRRHLRVPLVQMHRHL